MIDTLLFDFDGTLADTYPIIFKAFKGIFKEYANRQVTDKEIVGMFGPAEDAIIRRNFAAINDVSPVIERYYELYENHHDQLVPPNVEINAMLGDFKKRGCKLGIITGKGRRSLDISLRHLFPANLFDVTIAGDEVQRTKPHPEALFTALTLLNRTADRALFIGDSDFDFKAGAAAGIKTIGVTWFDNKGEFSWNGQKPDATTHTVAELLQLLGQAI